MVIFTLFTSPFMKYVSQNKKEENNMNFSEMTKNFNGVGTVVSRLGSALMNPDMLTGIATVMVPTTVGFAIWGTMKATKASENFKEDDDTFDKARKIWKYYVPTVVSGAMCIVCIIASNRLSNKQRVALAATLAVSEEALRKQQIKLEEETGIKTKIVSNNSNGKHECFKSGTDKTDYGDVELDSLPKDEKVWCRDLVTGNMFKTSKTMIDMANGRLKQRAEERANGSQKSLYTINDMYNMLGVAGCELGNDYFIDDSRDDTVLLVTGDVTANGEFFLKLDYFTKSDDDYDW